MELPAWLPLLIPKLENLSIFHAVESRDDQLNTAFWEAVDTNLLELKVVRYAGRHETLTMFTPALLRKVVYASVSSIDGISTLCLNPDFAPEEVSTHEHEPVDWTMEDSTASWRALVNLKSLKRLRLPSLDTSVLQHGFPPNLEELWLNRAYLSAPLRFLDTAARDAIRSRKPKSLEYFNIRVNIGHNPPASGTTSFESILDELLFWDSMNSPGVWLGFDRDWQNEASETLDDLERVLWERSTRVQVR